LVAGHVDGDERLTTAAAREAAEESGVAINVKDLVLKTVMHRRQEDERIDFFFLVENWDGTFTNVEPHKCSELKMFPLNDLPENTISYIAQTIECYKTGRFYSEWWK